MLPHRYRWLLLLLASYFFYGFWKVEYLSLIVFSTVVDFYVARYLNQSDVQARRRLALSFSLFSNLGLLFFFKYSNWFMNDVLHPISFISDGNLHFWNSNWNFLLPVGISFYTFQTISYTIDVYYRRITPETNPFKFALFVSFFPQLVAGPIERFSHLNHQLFKRVDFDYANIQNGARLMLYGLFIKMCVADNIAPIVDQIFDSQDEASTQQLWAGMGLFGIQIYSDFHGYSLIAIGAARMLGIKLMDNFNAPYASLSIREFWTRWHISLSSWFRDYLFIPLGGSRVNWLRFGVNILIVFIISGLWHGANWTFIMWGAIHGFYYLIERWTGFSSMKSNAMKPIQWITTMLVVFIAWVFFRSPDIASGLDYISGLLYFHKGSLLLDWNVLLISFIGLFMLSDLAFSNGKISDWLDSKSFVSRWIVYALMIYSIMAFSGTVNHPFIYFQF